MKIHNALAIAIALCFVSAAHFIEASEQKCRKLPDQIEKTIKNHAHKIKGAEYCRYRDIAEGDLDKNGTIDLIIAYNIEGACFTQSGMPPGSCGNNHTTFLTVFLKREKTLEQIAPIEVGGRGKKAITALRVVNGRIEADTQEYSESDALCCPSKKGRATFVLIKGKLKEAGR